MTKAPNQDEFFPSHHRRGLFYSAAWQKAWHDAYGSHPAIKLHPEAGLYSYPQKLKGLLPVRSATPIGATSPVTRSIRSEYLSIAKNSENPAPEIGRYLDQALRHTWDQLTLPDIIKGTTEYISIIEEAMARGLYVTERDTEISYAIDFRGSNFNSYLKSLGSNTRLQLYNRRKRLAQKGDIKIENLWPDQARFYHLLNQFHFARWGKPCYSGRTLQFMDNLLSGLDREGHYIDLSVMFVKNSPISVTLDITSKGRCYNLQSGYLEAFATGLSLGKLHFGYQIEKYFNLRAEHYDFMAGPGKNAHYKGALSTSSAQVVSLRLLKSLPLKLLYRIRGL